MGRKNVMQEGSRYDVRLCCATQHTSSHNPPQGAIYLGRSKRYINTCTLADCSLGEMGIVILITSLPTRIIIPSPFLQAFKVIKKLLAK